MDELTDRLATLGRDVDEPGARDRVVAADLERAHAGIRRRRIRQASIAVPATLGIAAAAVGFSLAGHSGSHAATRHPADRVRLVAYTGPQEAGFTVATVPDGFVLQGAQPASLDIAAANDHTSLDVFVGKLIVSLQSEGVPIDTHGTQVSVNGRPGYVRDSGDARTLEFNDGTHDLVVQAWKNIGLSDDQLVQFAAGITVTPDAVQPHG